MPTEIMEISANTKRLPGTLPLVCAGSPSPFGLTCMSVTGSQLFAVIPGVIGGYLSEEKANWIPYKSC